MKRIAGLSSFIFTASVVLAGTLFLGSKLVVAQEAEPAQAPPAQASPAQESDAKTEEIYTMRCVACHGADGNSQLPEMSFADGVWKHGSSEEEVVKTITEGVPGTAMMPFDAQLSQEEIEALAKYVRQFDPKLRGAEKDQG